MNVIAEDIKTGQNLNLGHFIVIEDGVTIGDNVTIESHTIIQKGTVIGDNCFIGTYSKLGKNVKLGSNCRMTAYVELRDNVEIGSGTGFGSRCTISANAKIGSNTTIKYGFVLTDVPDLTKGNEKDVKGVGSNTLIGANVCLMPGFSIGDNCIIGASTQIRSDIPDNEIWYGTPAKFYKKNNA